MIDDIVDVVHYPVLLDTIAQNSQVVVLLTSDGVCAPCRALKPHAKAIANSRAGEFVFVRVDIHKCDQAILDAYDVQNVPKLLLFKDGVYAKAIAGRTAAAINNELDD